MTPPIIFVPGAWHGAWCYEEFFVPWFRSHGYEARALDYRHHESRHPRGLRLTSISDYVADLSAGAAMMSSPPAVVGHSMGGLVVEKYLEDHAAPAAVLLAPAPPNGILVNSLRIGARHPLRLLAACGTMSIYRMIGTPERARELLFSDVVAEEDVDKYQSKMTDESFRAYVQLLGLVRPDVKKITSQGVPILVVRGSADESITASNVASTGRAFGVEPATIPGLGHDLMLEPAWEKVAEAIDSFVCSNALSKAT